MNLATIFLSETVGSAMLLLLGCGVVANTALAKTKGNGTGFLFVNWGWGIAVMAGVMVSVASGAHINFAVTMGIVASGATEFVPGIPVDFASVLTYLGGQMLGSFIGVRILRVAKPAFVRWIVIALLLFAGAKALTKGLGIPFIV